MVYVAKNGRPDLFITMTCNFHWSEIKLFISKFEHPDRNIIARVFHLNVKKLMDLIVKDKIFGEISYYMYTIKWQKRGLPHDHILV